MLRQDVAERLFEAVGQTPAVAAANAIYNDKLRELRATTGLDRALLDLDSAGGDYNVEAMEAAFTFGMRFALEGSERS